MANQCLVPSTPQHLLGGENPLMDMSAGAELRKGRNAHDSLCCVYRTFEEI